MYDVKVLEEEDHSYNDKLKYECIIDRSYYNKIVTENTLINLKSTYVPRENIFY
ncbi:hypothetical protein [Clostridium botulinum]|uniref:Uncharacterized protein n=1 Tax=Clostridium botulinum TaxID=1491 RepID=A0AA43Y8L8_CLOBO|nr:hypothetical protein [Clostridium botulinum]APQ96591.1 hypothetical protein RSJ3_2151 [Clostridium botulinum]AUN17763.1 hypothetical protein B2M06_09235 [Clostridium botulinum]KOM97524.1 hypothetical protein ACP53_05645 [Clostridium botulinum]KON01027.1 hypothetical protein ACP49_10755 [Clostridium botulinum]MBN3348192.1 hypothetical protein [Clostridium botulinum]